MNFVAPKPGGVASATLNAYMIAGDTISNESFLNYYATNDLNTLVMDMTGATTRASVYDNALTAIKYNQAHGALPAALLFPNSSYIGAASFPNIQNIVCVAGVGYLAPGTIYFYSPYDYFTPLGTFMSGGGNVFLTAEVLGGVAQSSQYNYPPAVTFLKTYMHALDNVETGALHGLQGVAGDPVGNGIHCTNETSISPSQANVLYYVPDALVPQDADATTIFNFTDLTTGAVLTGDTAVCGVRAYNPVDGYKSVYMTFTMEAMGNTRMQDTLMNHIMNWFSTPSAVWENISPAATPSLIANYPNPFTGTTAIQFNLPTTEEVTIDVYDMQGALVKDLANGLMQSGANTVNFDGANLPAGVYEYRLNAASGVMTGLMSLVK